MVVSDEALTPGRIDEIARDYFGRLARADERRLCRFQPEDEDDLGRELAVVRREQGGCTELLRNNDRAAPRDIVDRLLAEAGFEAAFGDDVHRDLSRKVLRALAEAARLQLGRRHGGFGVESRAPLFRRPPSVSV